MASLTTRGQRLLGALLRWGYYAALVGVLYVLIVVWRAQIMWVLVGYTYALIVFAVYMARSGRAGQTAPSHASR